MSLNSLGKRLFIPFVCAATIASGFAFAQDKVAAIVNKDVITQKDLDDFLNFMRVQMSQDFKGEQLENKIQAMKPDLLGRLIEDRLILQEAKNLKIHVDESRVKARIDEIKNKFGSDAAFQESLKQQGLVQADLETRIRDQFLMYNIIDLKVKSAIVVDPSEVTEYYNKNKEEFKIPELRNLESLAAEDEVTAVKISGELKKGRSMEDLSKEYPALFNKISVAKTGELRKDLEDALLKLGVNEISSPVRIEDKYYVFRLIDVTAPNQQTLEQAKDRIKSYLFEKKLQEELGKWLDELKKHAYIQILAG